MLEFIENLNKIFNKQMNFPLTWDTTGTFGIETYGPNTG